MLFLRQELNLSVDIKKGLATSFDVFLLGAKKKTENHAWSSATPYRRRPWAPPMTLLWDA
jgi:hypothetical protein